MKDFGNFSLKSKQIEKNDLIKFIYIFKEVVWLLATIVIQGIAKYSSSKDKQLLTSNKGAMGLTSQIEKIKDKIKCFANNLLVSYQATYNSFHCY